MAGANTDERNLLIAIECASDRMAAAAGGTPVECGGNDKSFNLLVQIAQNLKATITGLGGSVGFQDYTSTLGLWQTIQCETAALTGLTGTSMNYPGWVNEDSAVNAVVCNLSQVDTNTGASVEEENISDYVPGLETIACLMNQIADNGFAPPPPAPPAPTGLIANAGDTQVTLLWNASVGATSYEVFRSTSNGGPYSSIASGIVPLGYVDTGRTNGVTYYYVVQAHNSGGNSGNSNQASATPNSPLGLFIASLLPFAPDLLIIADSFAGSNGDPVDSAPDSSGNNNPMVQANALRVPSFSTNAVNGKSAYEFSEASSSFLQCPFAGLTTMCSIAVFARTGANTSVRRICTLTDGINGSDLVALTTPISQYLDNDVLKSYYGGGNPVTPAPIADTNFHSSAAWIEGLNGELTLDNASPVTSASAETALPTGFAVIGGLSSGGSSHFNGKIAFHARWATAPSSANIAIIMGLVQNYYGL